MAAAEGPEAERLAAAVEDPAAHGPGQRDEDDVVDDLRDERAGGDGDGELVVVGAEAVAAAVPRAEVEVREAVQRQSLERA